MASINFAHGSKRPFVCGVCEGFYGKPWTTGQRKELFQRMQRFGMDTYLYAPKDDFNHRLYWRDVYSEEESEELSELIEAANHHSVNFVYAISPGLDISFSDKEEVNALKAKLDQVKSLGCESFALLFDDIDSDLAGDDKDHFQSAADAQARISNDVYKHLGEPKCFLFCPTEYCSSRAIPDLPRSDYLRTLGNQLNSKIDILWTGPKVVSKQISDENIRAITAKIKRPPVIWDNIHANDYDQTRVYLGPYDGRPPELVPYLNGVLTNPNCEFEANFIAMHTLAQWRNNKVQNFPQLPEDGSPPDVVMAEPDRGTLNEYQPNKALVRAVEDWLPEFYKQRCMQEVPRKKKEEGRQLRESTTKKRDSCGNNRTTRSKDSKAQKESGLKSNRKIRNVDPLEVEDLIIFCDMHYLPYSHGPRAVHTLKRAHWLIDNLHKIKDNRDSLSPKEEGETKEWYEKAMHFHDCFKGFAIVVDKFVNCPNRALLYELYNYVSDMRSALSLVNSYIKWNGMGRPDKEPFNGGDQEPWVFRGGMHSEFRRLLPLEGQNDMFPRISGLPTGKQVFTIRPYFPEDKSDVYTICQMTYELGLDDSDITATYPDLFSDGCIGGMLEVSSQLSYVLEDNSGIVGYAIAARDVRDYHNAVAESWLPSIRQKYPRKDLENYEDLCTVHGDLRPIPDELYKDYPSVVHLHVLHSKLAGLEAPKRLLACISKIVKSQGSSGLHTVIDTNHIGLLRFYINLGFTDITDDKNAPGEILVLGKSI